eukprot:TRINITY_DN73589_c0_g1_i1.p1 TRINITY_DN73589_c0_g1~~TRINITY_DN73589_c0_g1_i1.p1  ORF type:complete len:522 (-),score=125.78 TRINITY_DN73589_c0_g1_i1:179-1681(-)
MATARRMASSASEGNLTNSKMSASRRERLVNLKKREDLKGALADKFKSRFGHSAKYRGSDEVSVASSTIKREVDNFAENADVTETNLGRLERRLHKRATQGGGPEHGSVSGVSAYSGASARSRSLTSLGANMVSPKNNPEAFDWARLDEYASYLHEQDAMRQKMGVTALQRKLKTDLDNQVNEKQRKKREADEEEQRYHQNSMIELERWKATEQMRAEEMKNKLMREQKDRDEQLAFERKLKSDELQRKKDDESNLVQKIVNEMESEQRKFERKKSQTRAAMRKVFEENADDQRRRDEQHKAQMAAEAEAMREYNRILDEQEENRAAELANRMTRQKELMDKLQANVAEQAKSAGDNDAQRANAQQAEMDSHYFEAEKTKMQRLKQMKLENQAYLLRQMGEKDGRKEEERMLANIQSQILQRDTDEYNQIERQKAVDKRMRNFENRTDIERQMGARAGQRAPEMSEAEIAMNKPLLQLVHRTLASRDDEMNEALEMGSEY